MKQLAKTIENWNDLFCHGKHSRLDVTDGQCKNALSLNKTTPKQFVAEENDLK